MKRHARTFVIALLTALAGIGLYEVWSLSRAPMLMESESRAVQTRMLTLARTVDAVESYIIANESAPNREHVDVLLAEVAAAATALQTPPVACNHPFIGVRLPWLLEEIEMSRRHVREEPPDFEMARSLSGACTNCHPENGVRLTN